MSSITDIAGPPESNTTLKERSTVEGGPYEESGTKRTNEQQIRKCLICRSFFESAWAGERICRRCKDTAAWRSGAFK